MEDLVQEVYVRLCGDNFRRLRDLRSKEHHVVAAFIRTIVLSVVYDNHRVSRAEKRGGTTVAVSYDELQRELEDTSSGAAKIDRELLFEQVDRMLRSGGAAEESERNRSVFWLYYRQGLTAQEISAIPGVRLTQKGVESLLQRLSRFVKDNFTGVKKESNPDLRQQGRMG